MRIRCNEVTIYHAGAPGTVVIFIPSDEDPITLMGQVEELDAVMQRDVMFKAGTHES